MDTDSDIDRILASGPDQEIEISDAEDSKGADEQVETPCAAITGAAGTGKTFSVRQRIEQDPSWALLCATTGIAAVNLGTITLHSALGLYPGAIEDQFTSGYMRTRMHNVARLYRGIAIDESSMLRSDLLDMLYTTAEQVNEYKDVKEPFGITLIFDMCQLPPIKEKWETKLPWIFDAQCWEKFEANTTRLTKNWRQGEGAFLDALNHLRAGNGRDGAAALQSAGAKFVRGLDPNFDGTVILGRNMEVDNYNQLRYWKLQGEEERFQATRWGKESGGWKNIPDVLPLKIGAYVMVLANDTERDLDTGRPLLRWVNGDCGHIVDLAHGGVAVELVRTGDTVLLNKITRQTIQKNAPDEFTDDEIAAAKVGDRALPDGSYWDTKKSRWVRGEITYMPLRLAYATTVHKSQGLTLDRIQVDTRHIFMGEPAMMYVATSRCRTAEGLHIVGDTKMIERRCKIDEKVRRWL
jgi:ATP-dependent DNA helicase PIF1